MTAVQVRLKEASAAELLRLTRALQAALRIPVLVNDRTDVALAAPAAGVHLGPDDMPVALARPLFPRGKLIGASVGTAADAADSGGADYWGVGPWRATDTKPDAGPALGAEGFRRIVALAAGRPCIAIGGVRPADVSDILAAGGVGVAVVSGILAAKDVEAAARGYALQLGLR